MAETTEAPAQGFDPALANQLTMQVLTNALQQQQLNAAQARSMVANTCNVLTLGVQLNHAAILQQLTRGTQSP